MNKGTPSKSVDMFDKHGNFIKTFPSIRQAAIEVIKLRNSACTIKCMSSKIADACNYRRNTSRNRAANYIFKWHND